MNYLTAIVALPLFLAIFAAESALIFSKRGRASLRRAQKSGQRIVWACWVVSLLQMVSCFFWFFGFVFSDTENVLSEAMKPDERMDCFGLVGAEVLLSVFQWIFSSVTFYQCLLMASVASNVQIGQQGLWKTWNQQPGVFRHFCVRTGRVHSDGVVHCSQSPLSTERRYHDLVPASLLSCVPAVGHCQLARYLLFCSQNPQICQSECGSDKPKRQDFHEDVQHHQATGSAHQVFLSAMHDYYCWWRVCVLYLPVSIQFGL